MAQVAVSALKKEEKDRLVCTYAALILHDGDLEISVSNSLKTTKEYIWPFCLYLTGREALQGYQG